MPLRTCLPDCGRNHVFCRNTGCSTSVCIPGQTASQRSCKFRNPSVCKYSSLRFRSYRSFLLYGCFKILYGSVPTPGTMVLFCLLLGVFAISAPGVPGGTVMASLGIITGVLKFDSSGTALMLTIFALQDSFGTACNVTGDGALTLMLTGYAKRHNIEEQNIDIEL